MVQCAKNPPTEKSLDIDEVLNNFVIFKPYHLKVMALASLAFMSNAVYCSNFIFAAENVSFRCKDPYDNITFCTNTSVCEEWEYDDPSSFVAEFGLACQQWKRTLVGTVHSFGYMVGLLIVGPMSDRLGRKTAVVITGVLGGVFGVARSFSAWYWFYIAMEFLEAALGDICSPMYVLSMEIVSAKNKLIFYMCCSFGYVFGGVSVAFIAWLVPYWRSFLRVLYTPAFLFFFYIFLLDESPRWLLIRGEKDKAIKVLEKAAKKNKISLDKAVLEKLSCEGNNSAKFLDLLRETFKSGTLRLRFFVCLIWWTTSTFVNYGMMIISVSLQGNKYLNFALMSLVDIPGTFLITYILIHFNRKVPLILSFIVGAVLCLMQPFVPTGLPWLSIMVYMVGKLVSSFYFSITYLYTSELFPTYTRNSMHALCSSLGRVGSILAPQTPLLLPIWSGLPSMVFGFTALFAGFMTLLVPDISDDSLPDTVKQAEALGKSKPSKTPGIHNEAFDSSEL